ncbi:type I DNA topoisomerase [Agaribacter flavus]|uniref:DNA topoisomerase 1 n=1 Tax=Agaribacter flavus TaxID=1902781 RepID=A0ABV7FQY9_9ALTE
MGKSLVIVESPAKAKTINKYLGKNFVVKSSVGHVRDLPTKSLGLVPPKKTAKELKEWTENKKQKYLKEYEYKKLVDRMGVDPQNDWKAHYQVLQGKEKVVSELKKLAKDADTIYLATDLDREGEAIAWHLQELLKGNNKQFQRVVFNEITKTAIQEAFSHPSELNIERVNAQQARRFLDRVVGFMLSPLLWKKVARGLSAGRVQSVAVRLVVEREREIKAFVPEEFWDIHADLHTQKGDSLKMLVAKQDGKAFKPLNKTQAEQAVEQLEQSKYEVVSRDSRPTQSKPSAPFITSTLQQAASTRLGFGVKKTMMMAQRLYEAGHITYMRTDSTNLSAEAVETCRAYISDNYGNQYLPQSPIIYGSKEGAQEAHEAIRPSNVVIKSTSLSDMENDAKRLYDLIWRQFVACQMTNAKYDSTTIRASGVPSGNTEFELTVKGRVLIFDGWTTVLSQIKKKDDKDTELPNVKPGDVLQLKHLDPKQHFTKPIARFNEASLVKELEKRGIGRPSTYASIISTIQDRGYVKLDNKRFYAEKMGEIVNDRLVENFSDLISYDFTANMEQHLDDIAYGELSWKQVLNQFYDNFSTKLSKAELDSEQGGMRPNQAVPVDVECTKCGRQMNLRTASTGVFLGCSGYNLPPKERCTNTMNLTPGEEVVSASEEELETEVLRAKKRCSICDTAMDSYLVDENRRLHICGNTPTCPGFEIESGSFKLKGYDGPVIECDKCQSDMELKNGRFGKYFGCTNESCKNTRKLLKNGEAAPPKEDPVHLPELACANSEAYFVLRDGAVGIFLAASTFPKSRETRAPLVSELKRFRERLSPTFYYLADAPEKDPDGNPAIVRFSRKTKQQYIMSELKPSKGESKAKASGWSAWYKDGKWVVEDKRKK